jgi:quinol monooxygenase YgiN
MTKQLTLIARLTARPETSEDLGNGLRQLIAPTLSEEGAIGYVLHRDNDDANVWVLYETWRSRADLDAHFEQPYTKAMMARLPDLLAREMELTFATAIDQGS